MRHPRPAYLSRPVCWKVLESSLAKKPDVHTQHNNTHVQHYRPLAMAHDGTALGATVLPQEKCNHWSNGEGVSYMGTPPPPPDPPLPPSYRTNGVYSSVNIGVERSHGEDEARMPGFPPSQTVEGVFDKMGPLIFILIIL